MATYTVYLPPAGLPEPAALERARFVREAGSLLALVFPALWLLFQRLWYALLVYLSIVAALAILARVVESPSLTLLSAIPAFYLFLEGRELVRRRLERAGWRYAGLVEAADLWEAEARWFDANPPSDGAAALPVRPRVPATPMAGSVDTVPSIGIFGQ